jgi:KaiC domain protein
MNGERVHFGIEGLDKMLNGGLIPGTITSIIGTYGTGKTTFALYFIMEGLKRGEKAIYISLEEEEERIYTYMEQKGWDHSKYEDQLTVIKLDPLDFNLAANSIKQELPTLINRMGAQRVVIDPVTLYEELFTSDAERRQEMFRTIEPFRHFGCTTILTSETAPENVSMSKHNLIEFLSDTVILLRYIRSSDLTEAHLAIEVVKMRMSQHSREIKPYEIQTEKVQVFTEATVF